MFKDVLNSLNNRGFLIFLFCLFITGFVFLFNIFNMSEVSEAYFIDVGQGDAELLNVNGSQILIDGGPPNGRLLEELSNILPFYDRYIDLMIITHPQLDHFGGLVEVVKRYRIGKVIYTGRKSNSQTARDLEYYLNENEIEGIKVGKGDSISFGNLDLKILLPDKESIVADNLNNSSIVLLAKLGNINMLFTGDIGSKLERKILNEVGDIEILKVSHHGSKYSSDPEFIKSIKPEASFIQVGENSYGHPTDEVLERLKNVGSQIFRTDKDGTIKIQFNEESFQVFTKK